MIFHNSFKVCVFYSYICEINRLVFGDLVISCWTFILSFAFNDLLMLKYWLCLYSFMNISLSVYMVWLCNCIDRLVFLTLFVNLKWLVLFYKWSNIIKGSSNFANIVWTYEYYRYWLRCLCKSWMLLRLKSIYSQSESQRYLIQFL